MDRADTAGGVHADSDILGQANRCCAHAAVYNHVQIRFARAGDIQSQLACSDVDVEGAHVESWHAQIAFSRAYLDIQIQRHVVGETQTPIVARGGEMEMMSVLLR